MSHPKTPTYDRSHYCWQPPSSQASQSIIEKDSTGSGTPAAATTADVASSYFDLQDKTSANGPTAAESREEAEILEKPYFPRRRSTFNYQHESEEYKKALAGDDDTTATEPSAANEDAGAGTGRRGSITSKPFKPASKRTKSWDYRDKRGEMQMTMMQEGGSGPKEGFTEV